MTTKYYQNFQNTPLGVEQTGFELMSWSLGQNGVATCVLDEDSPGGRSIALDRVEPGHTVFGYTTPFNSHIKEIYAEFVFQENASLAIGGFQRYRLDIGRFSRGNYTSTILRANGFTSSGLGSFSSTFASGQRYGVRFFYNSITKELKASCWALSEPEPESWDIETQDTSGLIEVGSDAQILFENSSSIPLVIDVLAVGLDGEAAPASPVSEPEEPEPEEPEPASPREAFYIPKQLTAPDIWQPARKPVGRVKVDWSNPLTNRLVGCWLFRAIDGYGLNLADNVMSVRSGDYASEPFMGYGECHRVPVFENGNFYTPPNQEVFDITGPSNSSNQSADHTITVGVRVTNQSGMHNLVAKGDFQYQLRISGSAFQYILRQGSIWRQISVTDNANNSFYVVSALLRRGMSEQWVNGNLAGTLSVNNISPSNAPMHLFRDSDNPNRDLKNGNPVQFVMIHRRALEPNEIQALAKNAFQYLVPAQ